LYDSFFLCQNTLLILAVNTGRERKREREFYSRPGKENFRDPLRLNNFAEGHFGRSIHVPFVWHETNALRH